MNLFKKISKVFKKNKSKPKELPMHVKISNLLESGIEKRKLDLIEIEELERIITKKTNS